MYVVVAGDPRETIRAAEARIDEVIATMPFEARDVVTATWILLTATEDSLRLPLLNTAAPLVLSDYLSSSDLTKYGLKHAMAEVRRRSYPEEFRKVPKAVGSEAYKQAIRLLVAGRKYQAAVAGFSAYHAGLNDCEIVDDVLHFRPAIGRDARYRVRDVLESMVSGSGGSSGSPLLKLVYWTAGELPDVLEAEAASTSVIRPERVVYEPTGLGEQFLFDDFGNAPSLIPDNWVTAYGDKRTVERTLRALVAICAHHYLMITRGAGIHDVHGFGLASLLLHASFDELTARVGRLAGVQTEAVSRMFELLSYGHRTKSPDPALQPFFRFGDRLFCPAVMVCGSDVERNFLALLARVDPKEFDNASHAFETQMTERLKEALASTPWSCFFNRSLRSIRSAGEIDALVLDARSKEILVLELWWTIPPGETREVLQREQTAVDKKKQAARKVEAVRASLPGVLEELAPGTPTDGWTISGALVSESFLPTMPASSEIAAVTRRTIQKMLRYRAPWPRFERRSLRASGCQC